MNQVDVIRLMYYELDLNIQLFIIILMKRQSSNYFRTERRNFIKNPSIPSKKKVKIIFELIQHINFYDENNRSKLKRFFRKNSEFFPKTFANFKKIFDLDEIDKEKRSKLIFAITSDLDSLFKKRDYKIIWITALSLLGHLAIIFYFLLYKAINIFQLLNELYEPAFFLLSIYLIYSLFSLLIINQFFTLLTRSREKLRLFLNIIDKIIHFTLSGFYLASWFLLLCYINPQFQISDFILFLIMIPQFLYHIIPIIDQIFGHNLVFYDNFFLYLSHLIVLLKSRYKNYYDIPYFFEKLLNSLNQGLIRNYRVRIKNQEDIENTFLRSFYTGYDLKLKLLGFKLEMIYEIEDVEIQSDNDFSLSFLKNIINRLEEAEVLIGQQKFEFANITYWEKLFMKTEKNTILNKMIYPLLMGVLATLTSIFIRFIFLN